MESFLPSTLPPEHHSKTIGSCPQRSEQRLSTTSRPRRNANTGISSHALTRFASTFQATPIRWVLPSAKTVSLCLGTETLKLPLSVQTSGLDTRDFALDVVATPDGQWRWKDEKEFQRRLELGIDSPEHQAKVRAAGTDFIDRFERMSWPFNAGWERWRPPDDWQLRHLPQIGQLVWDARPAIDRHPLRLWVLIVAHDRLKRLCRYIKIQMTGVPFCQRLSSWRMNRSSVKWQSKGV